MWVLKHRSGIYFFIKLGSHIESGGHNTTKINNPKLANRNGISGFTIFAIGTPETLDPTKRLRAIGGVMTPIAKLTSIMIPKWMGLIPAAEAIGRRIGVVIKIAVVASIIIPKRRSSRLIISIIPNFESDILKIALEICAGTLAMVNRFPKNPARLMIIKRLADVSAESLAILKMSFSFISR